MGCLHPGIAERSLLQASASLVCPQKLQVSVVWSVCCLICPQKKGTRLISETDPPIKTAATYSPTLAVPSARSGLTSLFGMGRGGTPTL